MLVGSTIGLLNECFISLIGAYEGLKKFVFKYLKKIPYVRRKVQEELDSVKGTIDHDMLKLMKGDSERCSFILNLPPNGIPAEKILEKLTDYMKLGGWNEWRGQITDELNFVAG